MSERTCGVVLAGGQSRRMGRDKALLQFQGMPLITWMVEQLAPLVDEVIVSGNGAYAGLAPGAQVVEDEIPGCGPLGGVVAVMQVSRAELFFIVGVDMPALLPQLVHAMLDDARSHPEALAVALYSDTRWQPLHAVYRAKTLQVASKMLANRADLSLTSLLSNLQVRAFSSDHWHALDPERRAARGANTPAEWDALITATLIESRPQDSNHRKS